MDERPKLDAQLALACMLFLPPSMRSSRVVAMLTEADCRRTGREPDDFEVRVFVGALAGGLMAVLDHAPGVPERMYRALDFMEAGMPLRAPECR